MEIDKVLVPVIIIFSVVTISCTLSLLSIHKYYKLTYLALKNETYQFYEKRGNLYYFRKVLINEKLSLYFGDDDMIFDMDDGSIKLINNEYIHNALFSYFDPYTFYWKIKLWNWFKQKKRTLLFNKHYILVDSHIKSIGIGKESAKKTFIKKQIKPLI